MTLITENTNTHIIEIILTALLETCLIALLLELLSLQIITRIIFIADGQWYNIQIAQLIYQFCSRLRTSHCQHLQYSILGTIVRILSPTLALGNPDILILFCDSIMDITAHQLTGTHGLLRCQTTTHRKGFVHPNQTFNPRIYQEVITNSDFNSGRIS